MQLPINLQNLKELDNGAAGAVIDDAIRKAVADLDDRGDDGKPRQVVIVLEIKRVPESDAITAHVEADAKLPKKRTRNTYAVVGHVQGELNLLFQSHSPQNPYQMTLDEAERKGDAGQNG